MHALEGIQTSVLLHLDEFVAAVAVVERVAPVREVLHDVARIQVRHPVTVTPRDVKEVVH